MSINIHWDVCDNGCKCFGKYIDVPEHVRNPPPNSNGFYTEKMLRAKIELASKLNVYRSTELYFWISVHNIFIDNTNNNIDYRIIEIS